MLERRSELGRSPEEQSSPVIPPTNRGSERWRRIGIGVAAALIATVVMGTVTSIPLILEGVLGHGLSVADSLSQIMPDPKSSIAGPLKISHGLFSELSAIGGMAAGMISMPFTFSLLNRFR